MTLLAAAAGDSTSQIVQLIGAMCVLVAFASAQLGIQEPASLPYLVLNFIGSAVLAVLAALDSQYGFLLLQGVWAVVSAWGLLRIARGRASASAGRST